MIPLDVWLDTENDQVVFTLPAAEGEGDVTVLSLDLRTLTADDKRRLRHVRDEGQEQRPATGSQATRGVG